MRVNKNLNQALTLAVAAQALVWGVASVSQAALTQDAQKKINTIVTNAQRDALNAHAKNQLVPEWNKTYEDGLRETLAECYVPTKRNCAESPTGKPYYFLNVQTTDGKVGSFNCTDKLNVGPTSATCKEDEAKGNSVCVPESATQKLLGNMQDIETATQACSTTLQENVKGHCAKDITCNAMRSVADVFAEPGSFLIGKKLTNDAWDKVFGQTAKENGCMDRTQNSCVSEIAPALLKNAKQQWDMLYHSPQMLEEAAMKGVHGAEAVASKVKNAQYRQDAHAIVSWFKNENVAKIENQTSSAMHEFASVPSVDPAKWAEQEAQHLYEKTSNFLMNFYAETANYLGCEKWEGLPHRSKCLVHQPSWACATCSQIMSVTCGELANLAGYFLPLLASGAEIGIGLIDKTLATIPESAWVKAGATAENLLGEEKMAVAAKALTGAKSLGSVAQTFNGVVGIIASPSQAALFAFGERFGRELPYIGKLFDGLDALSVKMMSARSTIDNHLWSSNWGAKDGGFLSRANNARANRAWSTIKDTEANIPNAQSALTSAARNAVSGAARDPQSSGKSAVAREVELRANARALENDNFNARNEMENAIQSQLEADSPLSPTMAEYMLSHRMSVQNREQPSVKMTDALASMQKYGEDGRYLDAYKHIIESRDSSLDSKLSAGRALGLAKDEKSMEYLRNAMENVGSGDPRSQAVREAVSMLSFRDKFAQDFGMDSGKIKNDAVRKAYEQVARNNKAFEAELKRANLDDADKIQVREAVMKAKMERNLRDNDLLQVLDDAVTKCTKG